MFIFPLILSTLLSQKFVPKFVSTGYLDLKYFRIAVIIKDLNAATLSMSNFDIGSFNFDLR